MAQLTVRTSVIMVATAEETKVYRSLNNIPANVRQQLDDTAASRNCATILIADQRGREEIVKSMRGMPTQIDSRLANSLRAQLPTKAIRPNQGWRSAVKWLEILVPAGLGILLWFLIEPNL